MKELERDLGMSRTALSAGMLLFTLALVVSPLVGNLIDKFGVRVPIATSLSALALCYVSFAFFLRSVFSFYLLNFVCALACAGSTPLSFTRAVNDWFTRARGLALGMMLMGTGLTAAMLPRVLATVINAYNWRAGYLFLSMLVVGTGPIIVWLVRLNPNKPQMGRKGSFGTAASIRTALYSSTFWMMLAAFFMLSLGISGLLINFVPLLTDAGISRTEAASRGGFDRCGRGRWSIDCRISSLSPFCSICGRSGHFSVGRWLSCTRKQSALLASLFALAIPIGGRAKFI